MTTKNFKVEGMFCANCATTISQALLKTKGVVSAKVDLSKNMAHIVYDESVTAPAFLKKAVKSAGYDLVLDDKADRQRAKVKTIVLNILSGILLVIGLLMAVAHIPGLMETPYHHVFANDILGIAAGTLGFVLLGYPYANRAIRMLLSKRTGMDMLVFLSTLSAYVLSLYLAIENLATGSMTETYFDSLLLVLSVVTLGHGIETKVKSLSGEKSKVASKADIGKAKIEYLGNVAEVEPETVKKGDVLVVNQGDVIQADGIVLSGNASLDLSSLSGESKPIPAKPGQSVYAGSLVSQGNLRVKATVDALDSFQNRLEQDAYALNYQKGNLGKLSDAISAWFVPFAVAMAIVGFLVNYLTPLAYMDLKTSLIRAIAVLVVSCPCAFGLAVPLTALNGYYLALRHNIVFKSGSTFEKVKGVKKALFDKTGTLTEGKMAVVGYQGSDKALAILKGMEKASSHPMATAILSYRPEVALSEIPNVTEIPGKGLTSDGYELIRMEETKDPAFAPFFNAHQDAPKSALIDKATRRILASVAFEDALKPHAKEALDALRKEGIQTVMITGDAKGPALRVGKALGFQEDEIHFGLLPNQKEALVKDLTKTGETAYVGDGINDMGALASASLSIAPAKASAMAKSQADCLLLTDDLACIPTAIAIAKRSYRIVVENFVWAFAYNIALMPLAMTGYLWMWLCALTMILSNITLMLNSLRANRLSKKDK